MEDDAGPVLAAVRGAFGTSTRLAGLAPDLVVAEADGWVPAAGHAGLMLAAAQRHWDAAPHVAAALMWKAYTYWLAVPVAFSWVAARRVPRVAGPDVLLQFDPPQGPVRLGLRTAAPAAVLTSDPLAAPGTTTVTDETALLAEVRRVLLDEHVDPLMNELRRAVRVGRRLLLGSLAANLAHATRHAVRSVPGGSTREIGTLLRALDLDDLVDWTADPSGHVTVVRRTCCLAFTLPQPRFCTDCCCPPPSAQPGRYARPTHPARPE